MATGAKGDLAEDLGRENESLRRQVAELQDQLVEQAARTNEIIAGAQERVYWLDRWHIDMETIVAVPGVTALRALVRAVRAPLRLARKLARIVTE